MLYFKPTFYLTLAPMKAFSQQVKKKLLLLLVDATNDLKHWVDARANSWLKQLMSFSRLVLSRVKNANRTPR